MAGTRCRGRIPAQCPTSRPVVMGTIHSRGWAGAGQCGTQRSSGEEEGIGESDGGRRLVAGDYQTCKQSMPMPRCEVMRWDRRRYGRRISRCGVHSFDIITTGYTTSAKTVSPNSTFCDTSRHDTHDVAS